MLEPMFLSEMELISAKEESVGKIPKSCWSFCVCDLAECKSDQPSSKKTLRNSEGKIAIDILLQK